MLYCYCGFSHVRPAPCMRKLKALLDVFWQEVAAPVEDGVAEETTLLTGPIQGDVVTINQKPLDLMLLQVSLLGHHHAWGC